MSAADTRAFLGDHIPATYWNGSAYVDITFDYQVSFTALSTGSYSLSEVSEAPCDYMVLQDTPYLCYYAALTSVNTNPDYVTVHLQPQYSIFGTDWLYTGFALSTGSSSSPSSAVYDSPQCNWYLGGTMHNFYNSNDSTSSSGQLAYIKGGTGLSNNRFTYIPVYTTSASSFSAYCQDASFYGNSRSGNTWGYYFLVMCPYVSGPATGGSGTFATSGTDSGNGNINVTVNIDMSETNSLLGDILDGLAPISELVGLLADDVDIPEAGTIASIPYSNDDYDNMIMTADAILDDIPDTVAAASFWVEITNAFFPQNSWLRVIMPLLMIMALMSWLLWKK